jgi:hypothetical protein
VTDPEGFLRDLVAFLNEKCSAPEAAARFSALSPWSAGILLYRDDAHLTTMELGGKRAFLPNPELVRDQPAYAFIASYGGAPLRIRAVSPSQLPSDVDMIFSSVPVIAAIVNGRVDAADGTTLPFGAAEAYRDGWLAFTGRNPLEAYAVLEQFRDLIDLNRPRLRPETPAFRGGLSPELQAEDQQTSAGVLIEDIMTALRSLGATPEEIAEAERELRSQDGPKPRFTIPESAGMEAH